MNPSKQEGKSKGKFLPRRGHGGPEGEQMYSSTLSLTLALDMGGWSSPRPGRFTSGKKSRKNDLRQIAVVFF
jgi:hypothetical protein